MAKLVGAVSLLLILAGLGSLTQATLGVGLLCLACWLGIMMRVSQAAAQHGDIVRALAAASSTRPQGDGDKEISKASS